MAEKEYVTFDVALAAIHHSVDPLPPTRVPLERALGCLLATTVLARVDLPPSDSSAMDGYAFTFEGQRAGDEIPVVGTSLAGNPFSGSISKKGAVKIMTGGVIPEGCDAVLPIEEVEDLGSFVRLLVDAGPGANIRYRGEEIRKEDVLLEAGKVLGAREIGFLAAGAISEVDVVPIPRVALFSTGEELVDLGSPLSIGQIVNSNFYFLTARLRELGCTVIPLGTIGDRVEDLKVSFHTALEADIILSTGGVSVGERDLVREALDNLGFEPGFWKTRIRPGKPVLFGTLDGKPVFGLPGNPAACGATFELFVVPALERMAGMVAGKKTVVRAATTKPLRSRKGRDSFVWGVLEWREGAFLFTPNERQGSAQHRSMAGSNALFRLPPDLGDLPGGWEGEAFPLRQHLLGGVL